MALSPCITQIIPLSLSFCAVSCLGKDVHYKYHTRLVGSLKLVSVDNVSAFRNAVAQSFSSTSSSRFQDLPRDLSFVLHPNTAMEMALGGPKPIRVPLRIECLHFLQRSMFDIGCQYCSCDCASSRLPLPVFPNRSPDYVRPV
jgi:hypothetical protein